VAHEAGPTGFGRYRPLAAAGNRFTGNSIGSFVGLTPTEYSSRSSRALGAITKTSGDPDVDGMGPLHSGKRRSPSADDVEASKGLDAHCDEGVERYLVPRPPPVVVSRSGRH